MLVLFAALMPCQGEARRGFREDFNDLQNWRPLNFPKIANHTVYSIASDGEQRYLKAESDASASGIIYKETFDVYRRPKLKWRWKVENIYHKADASTKQGDDYPIRVYVLFKYDPKYVNILERIMYNAVRLIYGEYPPLSALNYVWGSKPEQETIITSPYTDKAKMILLRQGDSHVGEWVTEEINIMVDYQKAFGKKPPPIASLGVMNDSDNTGEKSTSYVDFIRIYK
jgi:hypothetical protein